MTIGLTMRYYFGMKNTFPRIASLVLVGFSLTIAITAQSREITQAEFRSILHKSLTATVLTYPRIETETVTGHSELRSTRTATYEKHGRSYTKFIGFTNAGTVVRESIWYDGENFQSVDGGDWRSTGAGGIGTGVGSRPESDDSYSIEEVIEDNLTFTIISETRMNSLGEKSSWRRKIDASGKLVESTSLDVYTTSTTKYDYPTKITPIKKPKLGSKEEI